MKKLLVSTLLLATLSFSNAALAANNVAIVDVQAVVAKSAQVQALKKEQKTKLQDLEKWVKVCKADIEKQKTQEGKEKLLKKNADMDITIDTNKLKTKPQEVKDKIGEAIESGDQTKIDQVVKETGVEKQSSYDTFLKQCFGSQENKEITDVLNSDKSFSEKLKEIDELLNA